VRLVTQSGLFRLPSARLPEWLVPVRLLLGPL